MRKELQEMLNKINEKVETVRNLAESGKLEEAEAAKLELDNMQKQFDLLMALEARPGDNNGLRPLPPAADNTEKTFANAIRTKMRNVMTEGSDPDGGYTVPEDIETRIRTYRESKTSLIDLVTVQPTTKESGQRTYKKRAQQTGFTKIGEGKKIGGKSTPQFERMSYQVSKYGGWFAVTNELLDDSDANITSELVTWIGDESRVTRNNIILEVAETKEKTTFEGLDDLKYAVNVTLGSTFKDTSVLVTNDSGFQYLDTLKDSDGKYILQPDPTKQTQKLLFGTIPVRVLPDADLPCDTTTTAGKRIIPMIIGDWKEAICFFDRRKITIYASNVATVEGLNAFEEDLTLIRAIEREDCKMADAAALVFGQVTVDDRIAPTA